MDRARDGLCCSIRGDAAQRVDIGAAVCRNLIDFQHEFFLCLEHVLSDLVAGMKVTIFSGDSGFGWNPDCVIVGKLHMSLVVDLHGRTNIDHRARLRLSDLRDSGLREWIKPIAFAGYCEVRISMDRVPDVKRAVGVVESGYFHLTNVSARALKARKYLNNVRPVRLRSTAENGAK